MPWTWRYEKADGAVVSGAGMQEAIFASQGDAESWLGENWRELLDSGVEQGSVDDDDRDDRQQEDLHVVREPGVGLASEQRDDQQDQRVHVELHRPPVRVDVVPGQLLHRPAVARA